MDIRQIRLTNYRNLLTDFANSPEESSRTDYGRLKRFAAKAGVSDRMLSHINNGRGNLGTDLCRRMEAGLGLPAGWMDVLHDPSSVAGVTEEEQSFLELALSMFRNNPLRATKLMADLALTISRDLPQDRSLTDSDTLEGDNGRPRGVAGFMGRSRA